MSTRLKKKMIEMFDETRQKDDYFECELDKIEFYKIFFNAGKDGIYSYKDNNICMFKYKFDDCDSVLIIISIPINSVKETSTSKNVAERIMEIVKVTEECFTIVDYTEATEVKKEKFIYLTIVKKVEED